MPQFCVVNESTEDTLVSTDDLQDAIRAAREVAGQGQAGEAVSILESRGMAIRQFVLMPDGTVAEQAIARQVKRSGVEPERNGVESAVAAERSRE